jgi:MFS family permease
MTTTGSATDAAGLARRRPTGLVIAVLALAGLAVAVMQTLLVPLIPELPQLLGVTADDASWLITATLLAGAVATPSLSRLADMHGKRRMMALSLAVLGVGSVLGAVGGSLGLLILARALQGCGMALIPIGISIMRDELPREKLGAAVALMSGTLGIGAAVGLPMSGVIYAHLGWHALFWISAAFAVILLVAVLMVIPESPVRSGGAFDLTGAVLLSGMLVALLLGITKGGHWGWLSPATLASFLAAAVLAGVWAPWELRSGQPIVDLRTSARRPVLLTNIASFLVGFAMYCNMLSTTEILQMPTATGYGFGLTVVQAGLGMLPAALMMVLLAPVSAGITRRRGAKATLIVGAALLAAGYVFRVFMFDSIGQVVLGAMIVSSGTAIAYAAAPVLIMRAVPVTETAAANGVNTVMRGVGTSTASAAVAAILTAVTMQVGGLTLPTEAAFQRVFVIAATAAALGGLVALGLPRHRRPATEDDVRAPGQDHEHVVRGCIVDGAGRPLEHATVSVSPPGREPLDWARTDDAGRFAIAVPEPGPYLVTALDAHGTHTGALEVEVVGGAALDVCVDLRPRITA